MKRIGWIGGALLIVCILVVVEMAIISNASGCEAKACAVYAKAGIDKNTVITGDMLEVKEIDAGMVHRDALRNIEDAVSKRAAMDIQAGEMMLEAKLLSDVSGMPEAKDKDNRLFSVEFGVGQANGWQLSDDRYVDIIFIPNHGEQKEEPPAASGVVPAAPESNGVKVLKNIRIAGLIDKEGKLLDNLDSDEVPGYISFEVTPDQAAFLAYAKSNGKLELCLIPE